MKLLDLLVFFFISLFVLGGCGGSTSTTTYYYYPNWTPDGKIICSKNIQTTNSGSGVFGGSGGTVSNSYSFTIMDVDGSNEQDIKGINNSAKVAASPLGNYYAYAEIQQNYIKIITTNGNAINSIDCGAWVDSLDWSPDESKLVFGIKTSATSEIYTVNRDGTGKTFLAIGENIAWRVGDNIAFEYSTPKGITLSTIKNNGSSLARIAIGYNAQFLTTNSLLFNLVPQVKKINIDGTQNQEIFTGYYYRERPKLSFDNKKIAAMDANNSYGIYIINITGTGEVQIK